MFHSAQSFLDNAPTMAYMGKFSIYAKADPILRGQLCVDVRDIAECMKHVVNQGDWLSNYYNRRGYSSDHSYMSLYEIFLCSFIDSKTIHEYSEHSIVEFLTGKVRPVSVQTVNGQKQEVLWNVIIDETTGHDFDLRKLIIGARALSYVIATHAEKSQIELYNAITNVVRSLTVNEQALMCRCVQRFTGPLTNLATSMSLANFNFVMSNLKLSLTIPLLHKFMTSPSITGKIVAIWQLMEAHGILWASLPVDVIQKMLGHAYTIFQWLLTKTRAAADMATDGVKWVKAKAASLVSDEKLPVQIDVSQVCDLDGPTRQVLGAANPVASWEVPLQRYYEHMTCVRCLTLSTIGCDGCRQHLCHTCSLQSTCNCMAPFHETQDCHCFPRDVEDLDDAPVADAPEIAVTTTETPLVAGFIQQPAPTPSFMQRIRELTAPPKVEKLQPPPEKLPEGVDRPSKSSIRMFLESLKLDDMGQAILDFLEQCVRDVSQFFEDCPLFAGLLTLAGTASTFFGCTLPFFFGSNESVAFVKRMSDGLRCAYYANKGSEGILSAITGLFNTAKDILGISTESTVRDFKKKVANMSEICRDMLNLAQREPGKFINDSQAFGVFKQNMEEVAAVYKLLAQQTNTAGLTTITPIWNALNKSWFELCNIFQKFTASVAERQVPVCVWLYGRSDLGKSTFLSYLADRLNEATQRCMQVFTISKGPEYWNGFAQHDIVKIDDFASWVGPDGNTDALNVFNLITNAAYNPNMAAITDKNTMANLKFLFVASNKPTVPMNSGVVDLEAFERRRHMFITVTWPEHEDNCQPGERNCTHWQQVQQANSMTLEDFTHLTFTISDPLVTYEEVGRNGRPRTVVKTKDMIVEEGTQLTVDQIVAACLSLETSHRETFQKTLKRKQKMGSILPQASVTTWANKPNVFLAGPPGTGKTYIMDQVVSKWKKDKVLYHIIGTITEFDNFMSSKMTHQQPTIVYFKDISAFISSAHFMSFIEKLISRNDDQSQEVDLWIMCVNMDILEQAILEHHSLEHLAYLFRRCEIIDFKYNQYWSYLTPWKKETYTAKHVESDPASIERYVNRLINETSLSVGQVKDFIQRYKPQIKEEHVENELLLFTSFVPDTAVNLQIDTESFKSLCNGSSPMTVASRLISMKPEFVSKTQSLKTVANKLYSAIRRSGASTGKVLSLDAMFLEAWNLGYFESFKGENYLLKFQDKSYCIDGKSEPLKVGVMNYITSDVVDGLSSLSDFIQVVDNASLLEVGANLLPPWVALAGDIVMSVAKTFGTALVCAAAIKEEVSAQKAVELADAVDSGIREYTDEQMRAIPEVLNAKLMRPGLAEGVKTPQHICIEEDNPFNSYVPDPVPILTRVKENGTDPTRVKPVNPRSRVRENGSDPTKVRPVNPRGKRREAEEQLHVVPNKEITFKANSDGVSTVHQVATDPTLPSIVSAIMGNCVQILDRSGKRVCYGLMVRKRLGTTVAHLLEFQKSGDALFAKLPSGDQYKIKVTKTDHAIDRMDFEIEDKKCPEFSDITHHFHSSNAPALYQMDAVLLNVTHDVSQQFPTATLRSYKIDGMTSVVFNDSDTSYYQVKYVGHKVGVSLTGVQTAPGDCGSVLIIANPRWTHGKILGLHTGASTVEGYARLVTREHYQQQQSAFPSHECVVDPEFVRTTNDEEGVVGVTVKRQFVPAQTKLYRNLVPIGERKFEPSILSNTDTRNPDTRMLKKEAMKYMKRYPVFDQKRMDMFHTITDQLADYYADALAREDIKLTVLTRMQALNKLSGCDKSEPINIKTSPGFPYADMAKRTGKRDYIYADENGILRFSKAQTPGNRYLKRSMDQLLLEARGLAQQPVMFKMFLKDEPVALRKIYARPDATEEERLEEAKTRSILAGDLAFQIVHRQYTHSLIAHVADNWDKLPPKIGINPTSMDWNTLFHRLASKSLTALDIDYKGWDFSPNPFLISLLPRFYNRIYRKLDPKWKVEDDEVRNVLYSKIANFLMVVGCTVMRSNGGIPSGHPGTSFDNSIINDLINIAVYWEMMEKINPRLCNVWSWFEDVCSAVYGDDRLMTFSASFQALVNLKDYQDKLAEFGFIATGANKESELKFKDLMKCTFMSRGFRRLYNFTVGPLNMDKLCKTSWWVHDSPQYKYDPSEERYANTTDNIWNSYLCMLQEASLHGREHYSVFREAASRVRTSLALSEYLPSYEDMITRLFGVYGSNVNNHAHVYDEKELLDDSDLKYLPQPNNCRIFHNRTSFSYGPSYAYNGHTHAAAPMPSNIIRLLRELNDRHARDWNSVLVNIYPPGGCIPYHKDDEPGLVKSEGVGCLTVKGDGIIALLGDDQTYQEISLAPGDFYIMEEYCLQNFLHKRFNHKQRTISLTFRKLV